MKAINHVKQFQLKYPRHTPRISRKRNWYDRSEWRQDPQALYEGSTQGIDSALDTRRQVTPLGQENYPQVTNLMRRAATVGVKTK